MTHTTFEEQYYKSGTKKTGTYEEYDFDKYVSYYSKILPFLKRHIYQEGKVLDLGCAKGSSTLALRLSGLDAYGVDVSYHAINTAPSSVRSYLSVADLNLWKPDDKRFTTILCFGVLEYLKDLRMTLNNLNKSMSDDTSVPRWMFVKTLTSTSKSDRLRINCVPLETWVMLGKEIKMEYDPIVSADFERSGLLALHEFSIEHPDSFSKTLYKNFHRVFGLSLSLKLLKSMNNNLEFIAFKKV